MAFATSVSKLKYTFIDPLKSRPEAGSGAFRGHPTPALSNDSVD
jgi:hypothetical protein